ncbi:hypothetical protein Slin_3085 [Spirosoma linguale DSM 74]|uniref:Uncharacterized protein n=1 Tax=Spirosoma linguale (strain ATCC 33905 / DSM 74 / LMG 10896 / Claus 1) TaxID=504472 RepID=D2QLE9_SPILD|nr:hypothetical protein Slin_3085 [Spirosoma linguale DSM 74]
MSVNMFKGANLYRIDKNIDNLNLLLWDSLVKHSFYEFLVLQLINKHPWPNPENGF